MDLSSIHDCFFIDNCILSTQQGFVSYKDETTLPAGIAHCTIRNCILFPSIAVFNNTLIENSIILPNSIVIGCGRISCNSSFRFGYQMHRASNLRKRGRVQHGERNGRPRCLPVCRFDVQRPKQAHEHGESRWSISTKLSVLQPFLCQYREHIRGDYCVIDSSFVENCPLLLSCFIGRCSHVISSTMRNCTILSSTTNSTLYVWFVVFMLTELSRVI